MLLLRTVQARLGMDAVRFVDWDDVFETWGGWRTWNETYGMLLLSSLEIA